MTNKYQIVALPGEGIGEEVVPASLTILQRLAERQSFSLRIDYGLIGQPALKKLGAYFPEETAQLCQGKDGILFGAVTKGGLLELRQRFDFFANLRPVKVCPSLINKSSLKQEKAVGIDILFVRELVSGIYFGASGRTQDDTSGYHTMTYGDRDIKRIAKIALVKAQQRRGLLTVTHKENALPQIPWTRLVQEEARNFPDVTVTGMLVDNLAMQLVINPQQFDVIVAGNLFGDILSDLGGALVGSIGLLGSASLNSAGFGMYEAIHGTAPAIAGKGIAKPLGTLASIIMMLEQWGEIEAAQSLNQAQAKILERGYRTADLNPQNPEILVNTEQLVELFLQELS
ncbi:MAG: isocitrate/isopropylmalate family dehydrogenase [Pleurocapsa sp. MO_192.B19]|nr:isocitrate/isopropylmalate family dehydrogenase [Pleurocapsa sp. MO_192.B19]